MSRLVLCLCLLWLTAWCGNLQILQEGSELTAAIAECDRRIMQLQQSYQTFTPSGDAGYDDYSSVYAAGSKKFVKKAIKNWENKQKRKRQAQQRELRQMSAVQSNNAAVDSSINGLLQYRASLQQRLSVISGPYSTLCATLSEIERDVKLKMPAVMSKASFDLYIDRVSRRIEQSEDVAAQLEAKIKSNMDWLNSGQEHTEQQVRTVTELVTRLQENLQDEQSYPERARDALDKLKVLLSR